MIQKCTYLHFGDVLIEYYHRIYLLSTKGSGIVELKFDVSGMTCAACSARVEKVTGNVAGVTKADVNLLAGKMVVQTDSETVAEEIIAAVQAAGYDANLSGTEKKEPVETAYNDRDMKMRIICSAACLLILMYFTMGHMVGLPLPSWYHGRENALVAVLLQFFLTLPVVYWNRSYYAKGFSALFHRAPNMDSLIAVGSGAALIYGIAAMFRIAYGLGHGDLDLVSRYSSNLYFESAAMILTLITFGKFLEARAKGKTGDAVAALMDLSPKTATVRRDGREITISADQVVIGDIVLVRAGGAIPVDGTVVRGGAAVDESSLTGESVPVEKTEGDSVTAATINREGYLEILTDRVGEDTTLSKIIALVEQAGGSKAPIARLADKIAGIFVPVVMSIAVITFVIWLLAGESLEFALNVGISVLVISCPCALGLATPVAIMVGTGKGAGMGVLYKNAEVLENLHRIDTVVLDKTGTLTKGTPVVTDIIPSGLDAQSLLTMAASLERPSEHPFAKAIVEKAGEFTPLVVEDFKVLPGQGVSGIIKGKKCYGGNAKLMKKIGITVSEHPELTNQGKTPLYFAEEDRFLGVIAAADVLKDDSVAAVQQLRKQHLDVVMLTGDNHKTAETIGISAGIEHIISDVLPQDKAGVIAQLQKQGNKVLMVGDGINDAPALVTADVGMAVGAGADIAVESADIVLMNNSLLSVSNAFGLSKATIRNIRQNLFWAFFYNCLGIPIAAGVLYPAFGILLSPMLGAAAMSMSSVFVVTNALRLRLFKPVALVVQQSDEIKEETKMTTVIYVNGMMCPHCQARVESVCKAITGVTDAVVDLQKKNVTITGNADVELIKKAITDAGYEVVK